MKILVFSDSHNNIRLISKAIEKHKEDTDLIIHLGDCISDTEIFNKLCPEIANINIYGNCDYFSNVKNAYEEKYFILGNTGFCAFACHGHRYDVKKGTDILYYKAKNENVNLILYGHTHKAEITEQNGIKIVNPGSTSLPRGGEPCSYAVIKIENKEILPTIIYDK